MGTELLLSTEVLHSRQRAAVYGAAVHITHPQGVLCWDLADWELTPNAAAHSGSRCCSGVLAAPVLQINPLDYHCIQEMTQSSLLINLSLWLEAEKR